MLVSRGFGGRAPSHKESAHTYTHGPTRTCHGKVDFHGGNFASPCLLRLAQLVRTVKDIEGRRKIARNRLFDESMEISASSRNISLSSSYIYVSSRISIWNGRRIFAVILFFFSSDDFGLIMKWKLQACERERFKFSKTQSFSSVRVSFFLFLVFILNVFLDL